jgi:hypothetical protein
MWCRDCHKEVNAQPVGAAGIVCPLCRKPLFSTSRHSDAIQQAREILERWQSTDLFEKITTTAPLTSLKQQDRSPLRTISLGPQTAPTLELPVERAGSFDAMPFENYSASAETVTEFPPSRATTENHSANVTADDPPLVTVAAAESVSGAASMEEHGSAPVVTEAIRPQAPMKGEDAQPDARSDQLQNTTQDARTSQTSGHNPRTNLSSTPTAERLLEQLVAPVLAAAAPPLEVINPRPEKHPSYSGKKRSEVQTTPDSFRPIEERNATEISSSPLSSVAATRISHPEATPSETHSTESMSPIEQELGPVVTTNVQPRKGLAESPSGNSKTVSVTSGSALPSESPSASEFAQSNPSETEPGEEIRSVSAIHEPGSVESTNPVNQALDPTTKKIPRTAIRRPPLHRRFQLDHPDPESAAGPTTVTRKLRLDLPGAPTDNPDSPPAAPASAVAANSGTTSARIVSNSPKPGPRLRIDAAESVDQITETDGRRRRTLGLPKTRYIDQPHDTALRGPHFEVNPPGRSNLTSLTGQFLAYLGVLGLTIGTAIVIYGHFGGYSQYTPTGWLVTTVAQMLLFLGVINLVSGGIEQNNEDVSRRINSIGEQLLRIEQVTSEVLKGPKISAHHYADPESIEEEADAHEKVATHQA